MRAGPAASPSAPTLAPAGRWGGTRSPRRPRAGRGERPGHYAKRPAPPPRGKGKGSGSAAAPRRLHVRAPGPPLRRRRARPALFFFFLPSVFTSGFGAKAASGSGSRLRRVGPGAEGSAGEAGFPASAFGGSPRAA